MKVHIALLTSLASAAVLASGDSSSPRAMRRLSFGDGAHHQGGRHDGHGGRHSSSDDGPFGRDGSFDRPSFLDEDFRPDHVSIECDAVDSCDLRNGETGTWACRSWTHPITGEAQSRATCIPTDKAWATDVCGCCQDEAGLDLECPTRPEYITLECADETQPDSVSVEISRQSSPRQGGIGFRGDKQVICRNLINPYTGEEQPTTLFTSADRSIEGDTCGCCGDDNCTIAGRHPFERPDYVEKSCEVEDPANAVSCELPPRRDQNATEGFFVCRSLFDPRGLGESRQEAVCISGDQALETDECGCCGGDCPERPRPVDIDCSSGSGEESHECQFQNGESGVLVCRSIFHPFDGQLRERSFCISPNRAWITDVCGCCEAGCPTSEDDGFGDEATQLQALALEVPDDAFESTTLAATEGSSAAAMKGASILFTVACAMIALW